MDQQSTLTPGQPQLPVTTFSFIAEDLSLDFVNTLDGYRGGKEIELLPTYGHLLVWARGAGILTEADAQALFEKARERPDAAQAVLERSIAFREAFYQLLAAAMHQAPISDADLWTLNAELAVTLVHRQMHAQGGEFAWGWKRPLGRFDALLWPIVVAAADLLVDSKRALVRECASDDCTWLFLDTTRNHSRQWCTMQGCGNRAKIRRYRQKGSAATPDAS